MTVMSVAELTFSEIAVGEIYQVERSFTADDVRAFAAVSGDWSPLHVDAGYAATTEFGACVVHGLLLASLFSQLVGMRIPGKHALYLGQDLAFRRPVLINEPVTASARVVSKNDATRTVVLTTEIRTAGGKVAVSGSAKVRVRDAEPIARSEPAATAAPVAGARVALVTGGSRGIGAEIARSLGRQGLQVVVNYLHGAAAAERVVREVEDAGGRALAVAADVREPADVRRLIDTVTARFGRLDHVVNGATGELRQEPFAEIDWSAFQSQLDYHVKAVVQVCQAAYPMLKAASHASVVNVLSQVVSGPPPALMADYVTAKHALWGLSRALAAEWAADRIRVNMVSPGLVQTDLTQHYPDRVFKMEAMRTPLRRLARPVDVANAVAFLLSEQAEFLTGVNVSLTGGQVMD